MTPQPRPVGARAMEPMKPPLPVEVQDMHSFARLALGLTDGSQMLWKFKHNSQTMLAMFTAYMYWDGDIPLFAYTRADDDLKPFLAYKSDSPKGEDWMFSEEADDTRFKYAPSVNVKTLPEAFRKSLEGDYPEPPEPVLTEVEDTKSLARVLLPLSLRDGTVFPLWHFKRGTKHILGTCIPFEHYYDSDALPIFFYTESETPPPAPFIKYLAAKPVGEKLEFVDSTTDAKCFYVKIIHVRDFPLFPK